MRNLVHSIACTVMASGLLVQATAADELDEVVVTATLRLQPVATLPASATVIAGRDLSEAAVQHLQELLPLVPSLSWAGASSRPRYFQLRGIGELEQYQGAPNPSVGFLVDEVDYSGLGMVASLFDVEQVEVLRGPQGLRFGANGLAGLIKVKTRDPGEGREWLAEASAGSDALWSAGLALQDGFDGGAWRVAAQRATSDGFRRNLTLGRDDTNGRDERLLRAKLRLGGDGDWQVLLAAQFTDLDNGYDAFAIDNSFTTLSDRPGRDAQRSTGLSLDLRREAEGAPALRAITTWSDTRLLASFDGDWGSDASWGVDGPYDFFSRTLRERRTLSQDLRLTGGAWPFGWTAGAWWQRLAEDNAIDEDGNYLGDAFGRSLDSRYRADSAALYGLLEAELRDGGTLSIGLRGERRQARYADSDGDRFSPHDDMWGGQLAWRQALGEHSQGWLSLSRGYKAGGFNLGAAVPEPQRRFDPEYLWSLEAGLRAESADGTRSLDLAGHYLRRERAQVAASLQLDPQDPLTFLFVTDNAARGEAWGIEATLRWRASPRLTLSSALSAMESRFIGYELAGRDLDGRAWAHAPGWKLAVAADWRWAQGWSARLDLSGQAGYFHDTSHDQRAPSHALLNFRVGYEAERWSLHAWVHNALDRRYPVRGFFFGNEPPDFPERLYLRWADPRQLGITLRLRQ